MRLYELPAAFAALDRRIEDLDGELPESLESELDDLELTLESKVDALGGLIRQAMAEADFYESEAKRLKARQLIANNRADRLKRYLHETLTVLNRDKVRGVNFTARIQKNSVPSITWTRSEDDLPPEFQRVTITPNLTKAQEIVKAGENLPDGFQVLTGTHLRIV